MHLSIIQEHEDKISIFQFLFSNFREQEFLCVTVEGMKLESRNLGEMKRVYELSEEKFHLSQTRQDTKQ